MPVDYAALTAEIGKDDYKGKADADIAAAINAATVTVTKPIPAREIKRYFLKEGVLAAALLYSQHEANDPALRTACRSVYEALSHDIFTDLDPSDPEQAGQIKGFLDALQAAGCLSDVQRTGVLALSQETKPLWQTLGHRELDHGDIIIAKGERWEDRAVKNG